MGFTSFNSGVAGAVTLSPTADTRNLLQPSAQTVRPLTIRAPATLEKDLLRIEGSSGTPWLRFGSGPWDNVPVEMASAPGSMSLFVRAAYDGAGFIGSSTDDGTNRLYFTGGVNVAAGAGPHLFFDTGRGRPATEYWYTEQLHKHNDKHVFASGIESYTATAKHYYETTVPTESPFTVIYTRTIDWQTGRQIFNPGLGLPATYTALTEMRGNADAIPVLRLKTTAFQTGDLQQWTDSSAAIQSRVNTAGYFMTRKTAAPADGDLANSEGALWIDATTGNLKWKSKTSGGTVVTRTLTTA